ncbi:MAG TPA: PAS domain S-box protein [Candidatus Udaeobacter sp.]|jgi:PAS domain S-box-containing protein|nr:PAS domain S-box protein [Candidatus Udaeobacter sp.]
MSSEITAAEPVESTTTLSSSGGLTARAKPCPRPNDDETAAKYLFKLSHDVILSLDRVGNILCINQRGVQLSGYSETELRGANAFELLLFPEDRQVARAMLADVQTGKAREYEVRWKTKDGAVIHFDGATVPRLSDAGEFLSTLCTLRDVTERKCAEERLRKSEEKYRDLIEISPDAIYVVDADGVCVLGNRASAELAGIPENKLVGTPVTDTYLPEERYVFRERLAQLKTGGTLRFERNFVRKNGDIIPVEVSVTAIRGGYFQAILRDISERKRSEALLAGEKRLFEMIATGVGLKEILNTLCLIIEEQRAGTLASVLLLNADGVHLDCIAGPSLPKGWAQQMENLPIGPCAGSCGTAAYRGSPVIVSDIATDQLWDVPEHRSSALKHGLRASWSNPVLSSAGKVFGTFCMYYRETRSPSSRDLELIDLATDLVRIAIERDRAEGALRASEQVARGQVEALTYSLDVLATAPAPNKFLGQMLSTIGRLLGAQSVILWLLDESNDALVLRSWAEGTNFAKGDPEHPFIKNPLSWKEDPGLRELFFSGAPVACEDVEHDPFTSNDLREYLKAGGTKKFLRIPTLVGGRVKGFIGIRHGDRPPYRPEEIELAQALAHQAMLAIQLNEFAEQSRQSAVLEERNRMARDIHDTLAQGFTGVIVQLESAEDAMACCRRKEANEHLRRASELARRSLNEARRSVHALRPQALQRDNFWEALKGIVKNTTAGTNLHTRFELRGRLRRLSPIWQENLLHIGQEALTNALKHARPHNFETRLTFNTKQLRLELRDDGHGFRLKDRHDGLGLAGMRERVEQMGGELKVTSARGKGTKVVVTLPYNGESRS